MKPWEHFRLVSGYLPEIDRLPHTAKRLGLVHRVAAVLNYSEVPHSALYWDLVEALAQSLPADSAMFEIDTEQGALVFTSITLMRQYVDGRSELGSAFNRASFIARGSIVAFIDVEPWCAVGGPFPYSDSWTFAIYRRMNGLMCLRENCYQVCSDYGLPILHEMHGLAVPKEMNWWKRLLGR